MHDGTSESQIQTVQTQTDSFRKFLVTFQQPVSNLNGRHAMN